MTAESTESKGKALNALLEANRKEFNEGASEYGKPDWHQHIERTVARALLDRLSWLGLPSTPGKRLLDYACGPGMVTRTLAPYLSAATGVDIAPRMIDRYLTLANTFGEDGPKIDGMVGNLVDEGDEGDGKDTAADSNGGSKAGSKDEMAESGSTTAAAAATLNNFDIAAVGLGFHHFYDPVRATKALVSRLRPAGGVLLIVDFIGGCGSSIDREMFEKREEEAQKILAAEVEKAKGKASEEERLIPRRMEDVVRVHGFAKLAIEKMFAMAGLKEFEWNELDGEVMLEVDGERKFRKVFLAKGVTG